MSNYKAKKGKGKSQRIKKIKRAQKRDLIVNSHLLRNTVLGVVLFFAFSYLLFFSGVFGLKDVSITAPGSLRHIVLNVKSDVIRDLDKSFLFLLNRKSFFSANIKSIEANVLNNYPEISQINTKRVFPNGLFIELYERKEIANWCYNEIDCFLIDEQGIVFNYSTSTRKDIPLIYTERKTIPLDFNLLTELITEKKLSQILAINKVFSSDLPVTLSHFITDGSDMLHAVTKEGLSVYFVLTENMQMDITKLKLLFDKEISVVKAKNLRYIDLRFSKAYYK